jgi:hypothetical protein
VAKLLDLSRRFCVASLTGNPWRTAAAVAAIGFGFAVSTVASEADAAPPHPRWRDPPVLPPIPVVGASSTRRLSLAKGAKLQRLRVEASLTAPPAANVTLAKL